MGNQDLVALQFVSYLLWEPMCKNRKDPRSVISYGLGFIYLAYQSHGGVRSDDSM